MPGIFDRLAKYLRGLFGRNTGKKPDPEPEPEPDPVVDDPPVDSDPEPEPDTPQDTDTPEDSDQPEVPDQPDDTDPDPGPVPEPGVQLTFGAHASIDSLSDYTINVIIDILETAGEDSALITSTQRTPADQASRILANGRLRVD